MNTDEQQTPPQNAAGLDRSGTGHGGPPNATEAGRPDAPDPSSERPVDQEGPIAEDGSQVPPDPRVSTVPLDTDDGDQVVIEQQNQGGRNQVGAGEFKEPGTGSHHTSPEQAAREQQRLEREAPTDTAPRADPGSVTHAPDGRSPGDRSPASRTPGSPS